MGKTILQGINYKVGESEAVDKTAILNIAPGVAENLSQIEGKTVRAQTVLRRFGRAPDEVPRQRVLNVFTKHILAVGFARRERAKMIFSFVGSLERFIDENNLNFGRKDAFEIQQQIDELMIKIRASIAKGELEKARLFSIKLRKLSDDLVAALNEKEVLEAIF